MSLIFSLELGMDPGIVHASLFSLAVFSFNYLTAGIVYCPGNNLLCLSVFSGNGGGNLRVGGKECLSLVPLS